MLADDRVPVITSWFEKKVRALPGQMQTELRLWFEVVLNGSTKPSRRRPRDQQTIRAQFGAAVRCITAWAERYDSLREIRTVDVLAVLPTTVTPRVTALLGLRSIIRILKDHKLVFTNPVARIRPGMPTPTIPLPIDLDQLRAAIDSDRPVRAALASLQAFHALRPGDLRRLRLTDIIDGRLHLDSRVTLLAPEVRTRLATWLDERNRRWPRTANPHLFINADTAIRTEPVSYFWINTTLGMSAQAIREDRILDEAIATRDVRRICDLFGLTVGAALRYTGGRGRSAISRVRCPPGNGGVRPMAGGHTPVLDGSGCLAL